MAAEDRSERATSFRRQKARKEGHVVRSRELTYAVTLMVSIVTFSFVAGAWIGPWRKFFVTVLEGGDPQVLLWKTGLVVALAAGPIMGFAWVVAAGMSFGQGGFVLNTTSLTPNLNRLNPAANWKRLFSPQGMVPLLRSLLPASYVAAMAASMMRRDWQMILHASHLNASSLLGAFASEAYELSWKSALVLLVWAGVDYAIQKHGFEESLKMTKQEVREEAKDTFGNPTIKGKIKNLQRQLRRKIMMQNIERATVVVTNPIHYAVAIEYTEDMDAPVVVAKGRNLIAQQIKEKARWQGTPIVENKPLAQALYKTVEAGQAIPPQLYTAVAEILAFIYRAQAIAAAQRAAAQRAAAQARPLR